MSCTPAECGEDLRVLVMFGSQTGVAESIAQRIFDHLCNAGLPAELMECNKYKKSSSPGGNGFFGERKVIIVCSTTGNGDAPDNCDRFWRYLKRRSHGPDILNGMKFTILGLGDTNYDKFCYMGIALDKRLVELGAERFYDLGCADDAMGLDTVVEPWLKGLYDKIRIPVKDLSQGVSAGKVGAAEPILSPTAPRKLSNKLDRVLVMFGSQTGVAESIAQRIFDHLCNAGLPAELMECNKYKKSSSPGGNGFFGERKVIIVCSTTGNGDAPDNCDRFWRYLKRRSHGPDILNGMKFTILGLGDTNYDKFCYMGIALDKRLVELGAERFYDLGCADDAMGLDTVVEPWLKGLYGHFGGLTPSVSLSGIGTIMLRNEGIGATVIDQDVEAASTIDPIPRVPSLGNLCLLDHEHNDDSFVPASPLSPTKPSLFTLQNPCVGEVKGAKYLTKGGPHAHKRVIHLDISIPMIEDSSGVRGSFAEVCALTYTPGDAIGIICPNKSSTVEKLLVRLKLQEVADSFYTISTPAHRDNPSDTKDDRRYVRKAMAIPMAHRTPRLVLTHHLDLTSVVRKVTLKKLSKFCQSGAETEQMSYLCSRDGKFEYDKKVEARRSGLVDILEMFPSCIPPLDVVISLLPALMPRFYSVASSPIKTPNTISIAFTVVEYSVPSLTDETHQISRHGVCTTWLEEICKPLLLHENLVEGYHQPLEFFIREAKEFVLPANPRWPLIFVGPGTGVAPFIGFLSHREALARQIAVEKDDICAGYWRMGFELDGLEDDETAADDRAIDEHGPIHLFFGCQHKSKDFIYEDEILSFERTNVLTSLKTAFSRDQAEKIYVQHRLLENGQLVADVLLKENGYFYICGDGAKMAMDVEDALLKILSLHGENVTKDSAISILNELKERQRYVKDVWS